VRPLFSIPVPFALNGTQGVAGVGSLSLPLNIPADTSLVGAVLYFQAFILDGVAAFGVALTSAVEMWIG
jgi:hypothetical protein